MKKHINQKKIKMLIERLVAMTRLESTNDVWSFDGKNISKICLWL